MATRRPAKESRAMLIEAAAEIINSDGYAALSARRLTDKVGLKRQIVHYYFRTMDDLLLDVVRHYGDEGILRLSKAMETGNPLRAIWETQPDSSTTSHAFIAMAKHNPRVREEIALYFKKFRTIQVEAVSEYFAKQGAGPELSPNAAVTIIQSVSQGLLAEAALGEENSDAETRSIVEGWLDNFDRLKDCFKRSDSKP